MTDDAPVPRDLLRSIPSVSDLLETPALARLASERPRDLVVAAIRRALDEVREGIRQGRMASIAPDDLGDFLPGFLAEHVAAATRPGPGPVINATGVVLHTGLGRAPLAEVAREAVADGLRGYADLEIDRRSGERGQREAGVARLLRVLTGAEAATVVNNNAAACLLSLAALAAGGEVVVARGQLVEIGGSFRIPDVMTQSGARLVEVGTTNRVHRADYEEAIGPETALLLKVHPSNFRVEGFTSTVGIEELVEIGDEAGVGVMEDLGSGNLVRLDDHGLAEPTVSRSIEAGAAVVTFSGDKLLGGPQAGLVCGRPDVVSRIRSHPLFRAVRPDKMQLAALDATLRLHLDADRALTEVPALRLLTGPVEEVRRRAEELAAALADDLPDPWKTEVIRTRARTGSGALPVQDIPSVAVALAGGRPDGLAEALRMGEPPVFPRISRDRVLLDLRTVLPGEEEALAARVREALEGLAGETLGESRTSG